MPIEIKELHIKAVVGEKNIEVNTSVLTREEVSKLKREITKDVTEKIIRMLQQKNER